MGYLGGFLVTLRQMGKKQRTTREYVKDEGGKANVVWKGGFYRGFPNNDPPAELNDEAATQAVTGVYRAGLDALVEKFGRVE